MWISAAAGCSDIAPPPDPAAAPVDSLDCEQVVARWHKVLQGSAITTCATDGDCGSAGHGPGGCSCGPSLAGCGMGVNGAAYASTEGAALESRFRALACTSGGICDCGNVHVYCASGTCYASASGCTLGGGTP
jgi:hypothetical protein